MSEKLGIGIALVVVAVIIIGILYAVLPDGEAIDTGDAMEFDGHEYTWDELAEDLETKTVDGKEGLALSDILNLTAFGNELDDDKNETLFTIIAEDGWQKNVSWMDMMQGILLEEDTASYFPHLPKAYGIRDVESIEKIELGALVVMDMDPDASFKGSSIEFTWDGIFEELDIVQFTKDGVSYEGVELADVLEHAGFTDLANRTYTITGVDGYSKIVDWDSIQNGYLVLDEFKSFFPDLPDDQINKFKVRNVIRIEVNLL